MIRVDDMIGKVPPAARAVLAGLVLCGLILAMVVERASILRNGATVRLATTPVDPRDLFRGDYVVLEYTIGEVNLTKIGGPDGLRRHEPVHVGVKADVDGRAEVVRLARQGDLRSTDLIWLKATAHGSFDCRPRPGRECVGTDVMTRVTYGLETYFVPEGQGKVIETTEASRVEVVAAVTATGKSAIKALLIDGKPVYEEPPH